MHVVVAPDYCRRLVGSMFLSARVFSFVSLSSQKVPRRSKSYCIHAEPGHQFFFYKIALQVPICYVRLAFARIRLLQNLGIARYTYHCLAGQPNQASYGILRSPHSKLQAIELENVTPDAGVLLVVPVPD